MHHHPHPRPRRAVAAAASGLLVAGLAATALGSPPATAALGDPISGSSTYRCDVAIGDPRDDAYTELEQVTVDVEMSTTDPGPLYAGSSFPSRPSTLAVRVPTEITQAVVAAGATGASTVLEPTSVPLSLPRDDGTQVVTDVRLSELTGPRRSVPQGGGPWTVRATGTLAPASGGLIDAQVPGFVGPDAQYVPTDPSTYVDGGELGLPSTLTAEATLYQRDGSTSRLVLDCRDLTFGAVDADLRVTGQHRSSGVSRSYRTFLRDPLPITLAEYHVPGAENPTVFVNDPAHGTVVGSGNQYEYTADPGFTGIDTVTYQVYDSQSFFFASNTVTISVERSPAELSTVPVAITWGRAARVEVAVGTQGDPDGGAVDLWSGGELLGSSTADAQGRAEVVVPARSLPAGTRQVIATFGGTDTVEPDRVEAPLTVARATTRLTAQVTTPKVRAGRTLARIAVTSGPVGVRATGALQADLGLRGLAAGRLDDGAGTLVLPTFAKPGTYRVKVRYLGSSDAKAAFVVVPVKVVA